MSLTQSSATIVVLGTLLQSVVASAALNPEILSRIQARSHDESSSALIISEAGQIRVQEFADGIPGKTLSVQSISKTLTALLYLRSIDLGRVSGLDVKLSTWYPEMAGDSRASITVRSILTQSSGFQDPPNYWDQSDLMSFALQQMPVRAPFQSFEYSNMGYNFMGDVLDHVTGGTEDFLAAQLFAPIEIKHWYWERDAQGHLFTSGGVSMESQDLHRLGLELLKLLDTPWASELWSSKRGTSNCYAVGIWIVGEGCEHGDPTGLPGTPSEGFSAIGYGGQYIVIIPSRQIVAIRSFELPPSGEDPHPFNDFPMLVRRLAL